MDRVKNKCPSSPFVLNKLIEEHLKERKEMIQSCHQQMSVRHQCRLLALHRSIYGYKPVIKDDTAIANRIAEIYEHYPMYGYRRVRACLNRAGFTVNHKRVLRVMKIPVLYS